MNRFMRASFAECCGIILFLGMPIACADGAEKQSDSKPVTSETQHQIADRLLAIAQNPEESADARMAAIHSLRAYMAEKESKLREGILKVAQNERAKPKLRTVAATELIAFHLDELSEKERTALAERLWSDIGAIDLSNTDGRRKENGRIRAWAIFDLIRLDSSPPDIKAVRTLAELATNPWEQIHYPGMVETIFYPRAAAESLLKSVQESKRGVHLLIAALEAPDMPFALIRIQLLRVLKETIPKTEGIAQILLETASHKDEDIRAAAIEALGNEIPESDAGALPISPAAPADPGASSS